MPGENLLFGIALDKLMSNKPTKPENANKSQPIKTAIGIAIGVGTGFLVYKLIKKDLQGYINKKREKEIFEKEKDVKVKLTYKPSQYIAFADSIQGAFDSFSWGGTDVDTIYTIFRKLKKNNDWLELAKAYGQRDYSDNFLGYPSTKLSLTKSLNKELDGDEKKKINYIMANNGLKYRI